MSFGSKIHSSYHRSVAYLSRVTGFEPPELTVELTPDITRYFLSEAIEDRVKFLADGTAGQEESYRAEVTREYRERVELAIRQELQAHWDRWPCFTEIENKLDLIKLPTEFTDDLLGTRAALLEFMRGRMVFFPGRLGSYEALVLSGIFLRAVQQVALEIIRAELPATGQEVRPTVPDIVRRILGRVEKLQRLLQTPVQLKSPAKAETELRVLVARARGVVCLPLRSIPTAPLSSKDLEQHYVGRPDEQASKLARQIRHADGTILVTGYRGVGKSSFVNRVIFHALAAQKDVPYDGWLIVPVTVNLAKVAGVQNILRLTLRSVRDALLEPESRTGRSIPGFDSTPLPLSKEKEIEPLEEAYIRATYKVTMSQASGSERRMDLGSSISIDPGKWFGGKVVGVELGKFLEAGIKKTKTEKINRELSLLDFDENAAEESLGRLIRSLATPRPLRAEGPDVRIKLVFVFDELDKMDVATGLKPMIEGLKNLFLQQYSVFMLVTSKAFYYELLKDRAIEDAMMNSYFSAIVHVPLLSFAQARQMVNDWVDWNATEQLKPPPKAAESKLLDQLTRLLMYRSYGNPRDIIRELRLMQEWADTTEQPYLTDGLSKSQGFQIFAAVQECIEKTAIPPQKSSSPTTESDGSVTLASERLVGDEARMEQVRRGLYILTEELINRQMIPLSLSTGSNAPPRDADNLTVLQKIHRDNFSLLSLDDVVQLTKRLGGFLSLIHDNTDLFVSPDWGTREPLFGVNATELWVNNNFYALTGRQATAVTAEPPGSPQTKSPEDSIADAQSLALQDSWAAKLKAINIIKQVGPEKLTPALNEFLWKIATTDPDASHRLAAAERLPPKAESLNEIKKIARLLPTETDERVFSIFLRLLSGASEDEARKIATDAIVELLKVDIGLRPLRRIPEGTAVEALTVLQTVASHDVSAELLEWMNVAAETELVQTTAVSVLKKMSEQFDVDIADRIISNEKFFNLFTTGQVERGNFSFLSYPSNNILRPYLLDLLSRNPFASASKLMTASRTIHVEDLLAYIWDVAFNANPQEAAIYVFHQMVDPELTVPKSRRLEISLGQTSAFQTRILPYFRRQLPELFEKKVFTADQAKVIAGTLLRSETYAADVKAEVERLEKLSEEEFTRLGNRTSPGSTPKMSSTQSRVYTVAGILLFLPGFYFYKADLPSQASWGTVLKSRLLLLLLDGIVVFAFLNTFKWFRSRRPLSISLEPKAFFLLFVPLVLAAFYYLHTTYIGPLHFWPQVLQFVINWPAIVAFLVGSRLYEPMIFD